MTAKVTGEFYKGKPHGLCKVVHEGFNGFNGFGVMTNGQLDGGPFQYTRDGWINSFARLKNGRATSIGRSYYLGGKCHH